MLAVGCGGLHVGRNHDMWGEGDGASDVGTGSDTEAEVEFEVLPYAKRDAEMLLS